MTSAKFGTSGLRGLVLDLTTELVAAYTRAFLVACDIGGTLFVGRDLRASSPSIAQEVIRASLSMGYDVVDCGALPTPALACAAGQANAGAIMVTGSHIPDDRNGLKFYTRTGEITKADETLILAEMATSREVKDVSPGKLKKEAGAEASYAVRYISAFGSGALSGLNIGFYAHSAVGRDILGDILRGLGADIVELGRSDVFIPVDTEAVDSQTRALIKSWVAEHQLDALVSTDGDSDRPLLADERGNIVPGDIMGQITAEMLGAETVVTPISSNSGVQQKSFARVELTRIGSPYVIAGMEAAGGAVVGYEANGGFLLGFQARGPEGLIEPLMTRDCTLPLVAVLSAARAQGVAARVAQEPPVVTRADRLQDIPAEKSATLISQLTQDDGARAAFLSGLAVKEAALDLTDGLRITLEDGGTLHLRPSGNAPELRVYVEGRDVAEADALLKTALTHLLAKLAQN